MDEGNNENAQSFPQWYAVWTRSRQEKTAATMLDMLGVSHFLPLIASKRQWSDRQRISSLPLFPGYLFVQITKAPDAELRVRKVPGIVDFVGNRNGLSVIPEVEIQNVRALLSSGTGCTACPFMKAGDRVRIVNGALAGIVGLFIRSGARFRVVVSVEIIQRSISVEVSASQVELLPYRPHNDPSTRRLASQNA
jgi:transcription antitermination factor NusG